MKPKLKGQQALTMNAIPAIIITFVIVGFYLTFGLMLFDEFDASNVVISQHYYYNESTTFTYGPSYTVLHTPLNSVLSIVNNSAGVVETLGTGNYTVLGNTINLTYATVVNTTMNATINHTVNGTSGNILFILDAYNSSGSRFTAGNFTIGLIGGAYNRINVTCNPGAGCPKNQILNISYTFVRYNNTLLNVSYTQNYNVNVEDTSIGNITGKNKEALSVFSDRLPLLALVIFFAIILTVIAVLAATGRIQL